MDLFRVLFSVLQKILLSFALQSEPEYVAAHMAEYKPRPNIPILIKLINFCFILLFILLFTK